MVTYASSTPVNSYRLALREKKQAPAAMSAVHFNGSGAGIAPSQFAFFDGDKFPGGFGPTQIFTTDYWTLRRRSAQLFTENLYARGLIRRLVTNEINTGLTPESAPDEEIIGLPEDSLSDWTETVENRFAIWAKTPKACDWKGQSTFGALQRTIRQEALVNGDILVTLRQKRSTQMPAIQLTNGDRVQTPLDGNDAARRGHEIRHGVEFDTTGREVAYWIMQDDGTSKRQPAFGEKSGRRISWLVFGTDKRMDAVRGEPLLSIILQSLKEIDRYRDSALRKAVINSILAMVVTKNADKPGTLPLQGGALRNDALSTTDGDGTPREFNISSYLPGMIVDELQTGEDVKLKGGEGTDTNFGDFEGAIIQAIAWANQIPPEILTLAFSNNYSASQAAINEFNIYLSLVWTDFGETVCAPVYTDWLVSETLLQRIKAPGMLEAWRDPFKYDTFGAWTCAEWYGTVKISSDPAKQVKAATARVAEGFSTRAREARSLNGSKYSKNVKRLAKENTLLAAAARPMLELQDEFGPEPASSAQAKVEDKIEALVDDYLQDVLDANG